MGDRGNMETGGPVVRWETGRQETGRWETGNMETGRQAERLETGRWVDRESG